MVFAGSADFRGTPLSKRVREGELSTNAKLSVKPSFSVHRYC